MFLTQKDDCPICCFLNKLLAVAKTYTILDFAVFKTCLFSAGAMVGLLLAKLKASTKTKIAFVLTFTFTFSWVYIFVRTFSHFKDE